MARVGESPVALSSFAEGAPLRAASRGLAAGVVIVACLVLVGWATDVEALKSVLPGLASMKVNTALCFIVLGLGLLATRRTIALVACGVVLAVTSSTLVQYAAGIDLGIDQLLVTDSGSAATNTPGRMAPATAICLASLALALAASRLGLRRAVRPLLLVPSSLGSVALLGYVYGVEQLYAVISYSTVALHTAVLVVVLTGTIDMSIPGSWLRAAVSDPGPGGRLLRRFVPLAALGLPLMGYVRLRLGEAGYFGERFGIAVMVSAGAALFLVMTVRSARSLAAGAMDEQAVREELRALNASLIEGRDEAWRRAAQLAEELAAERAHFDQAIAKVDDLVWTARVADGAIEQVYASPGATGLFGGELPGTSGIGATMATLVHPDDRQLYQAFEHRVLAGRPADTQLRLVGLDGETRWVWIRGTPRRHGEELYFDGIASNVSERHQLIERVLGLERDRVAELLATQRMRDEFIALAGHELRIPLTAAGGYLELVLEDPAITSAQRRLLEVVERNIAQVVALVSHFFDLARINAGITQLVTEPVDLRSLVRETCDAQRLVATEAGVTITVSSASLAPIQADPERLRQVLDNVVSNAVKYTPAGGHVRVELEAQDDQACLRVTDEGIGIPEAEMPRVFDHLFRASTATRAGIPGTGLGLAVTKALVDAHHGSITVRPHAGGGTEFEIRLPRTPPSKEPPHPETSPSR